MFKKHIHHHLILFSLLTVFSFNTLSCKSKDANPIASNSTSNDNVPSLAGYKLVWNDEFNDNQIDTSKWSWEVNGNGGGNNELQYYTNSPENSYIKDSCLVITALKKDYMNKNYTSARLRTLYKGDWLYGRFEIRAKLPFGQGMWPAIWLLPSDWEYGGWPTSGEIDIMELLGHQSNKVYGTIHYANPDGKHGQTGGSYTLPTSSFAQNFHVFALEWDSTGFKWYVDDNLYFQTQKTKPFDKRFHMILNVAVGGNWPGNPDETTKFPQSMMVDYVRVYQKDNSK